jgi:hypothetical protein
MKYVRIISWHVVWIDRSLGTSIRTRCGRFVPKRPAEFIEELPLGDKSCETCLRLSISDA